MNRAAKGQRVERACEQELQAQKYITWKTICVRFCNIDLFGLFDVCALAGDGTHLRFIQCKCRTDAVARKHIRALKMPICCRKEIWIWLGRGQWKKEIIE